MKISAILLLIILASCNPKQKEPENTATQETSTTVPPIKCYRYANQNDTVTLKVIHVGNAITGTLVYNFKEKDKNMGTIQGAMKDAILLADYTFMSEGVQSVRQVAFKLENNVFVEGYGEMTEQNNKPVFKNPDALNFNNSVKLTETDCK